MTLLLKTPLLRHGMPHGTAPPHNEGARPALSEQQIQKAVFDHFAWRGAPDAFVCHYPAGGFRRPAEAAILKGIGTLAGVPDIIAVYRGRTFALEIKTETGRVTDAQHTVHDRMRRAGAEVGVAYGLDEALAMLEGWKLLRGKSALKNKRRRESP
jgi:hypothetical protein